MKSRIDDLLSDKSIDQNTLDVLVSKKPHKAEIKKALSGNQRKTTQQRKFEAFCKEYNLDYDFDSTNRYYGSWVTNQAFVVYKYSDVKERTL